MKNIKLRTLLTPNLKALSLFTLVISMFLTLNVNGQSKGILAWRAHNKVKKIDYSNAVQLYKKALNADAEYYKANRGLAQIYLFEYELYDSAEYFFNKALANPKKDTNYIDLFNLAYTYRLQEKPGESIHKMNQFYKGYLEGNKDKYPLLFEAYNQNMKYAQNALNNTYSFDKDKEVKNMDFYINSIQSEYTPVFIAKDSVLIYNARYKDNKKEKQFEDDKFMENLYYFNLEESVSTTFDESTEQKSHHAIVSNSIDSDTLIIFYKNILWSAKIAAGRMSKPEPLPRILTKFYFQPHGVYSNDRKTFIFSASKEPTDDLDLYYSTLAEDGNWNAPVLLSDKINTELNEDSPFMSADGTKLYFSSKGHDSFGGYDIFVSNLDAEGQWSAPKNLGRPYNSAGDDIYFVLSKDESFGYLSSNRNGGFGLMDIYSIGEPTEEIKEKVEDENIAENKSENLEEIATEKSNDSKLNNTDTAADAAIESTNNDVAEVIEDTSREENNSEDDNITVDTNEKKDTDVAANKSEKIELSGFQFKKIKGEQSKLRLSGTNDDGFEFKSYTWNVNGKTIETTEPEIEFPFTKPGKYPVELFIEAVDENGDTRILHYNAVVEYFESDFVVKDLTLIDNDKKNDTEDSFEVELSKDDGFVPQETVTETLNKNDAKEDISTFKPIYFGFDRYDLTSASVADLDALIDYLNTNKSTKLIIQGHTDAIGSSAYNNLLAKKRANAAVNYLKKNGIESVRILKTVSLGEAKPAAPNTLPNGKDNASGRKLNRRVEFIVQ